MTNNREVLNGDDHLSFAKSPNWLMRRKEINSNDKMVYIRLRQCGIKSGQYWASQEYLASECGLSVRTVKRSIKSLSDAGLISRKRHGKKMYNSYYFHVHEWMEYTKEVKCQSGTSQENRGQSGTSEVPICPLVKCQSDTSIYIDKKEQISIEDKNSYYNNYIGHSQKSNDRCTHSEVTSLPALDDDVGEEREQMFEEFWQRYPRKVNKKKAHKLWLKNKLWECHDEIMQNLKERMRHQMHWVKCTKRNMSYVLHPTTYINGENWKDEVERTHSQCECKKKASSYAKGEEWKQFVITG